MYDELVKRLRSVKDSWQTEEESWMLQAADAIEALICEVADEHNARLDAEERQRWIPVSERLPEHQGEYLVLWRPKTARDSKRLYYAILENDGNWVDDIPQSQPFRGFDVVYWMPLPELPEEGE